MPQFILEIGFEEMPARFLPGLSADLFVSFTAALDEAKLDHGLVKTFATPRRLVLCVADLSPVQRQEEEVFTGPPARIAYSPDGQPTQAAVGFAKGHGLGVESLFTLETDKGAYIAVRKMTGGGSASALLPDMAARVVTGLPFPKRMRWGEGEFAFGRPLRWILALLDQEVIPVRLAGLTAGRSTFGHRVLGPGPLEVASADRYLEVIEGQGGVLLDRVARITLIQSTGDELAASVGGRIVWKKSLLQQVADLVEHPRPILARFDPRYLEVPREVLLESMESHQKSFGVEDEKGRLLPYFLTTVNNEPTDMDLVRKGWERVLKARLEDARFFWESDISKDFDHWLAKLENVVFLGPLGSMGDKSRRLERLCGYLAQRVCPEMLLDISQAGRLAKADLVSDMVGEFGELQGIMGGIYARRRGESEAVARALYEQYLPLGPDSPAPSSLSGALLAVADKADTLAGCFGLGMIPTGAADPYALRRQALGIVRILIEHSLSLSLGCLVDNAQCAYGTAPWKLPVAEAKARLLDFFAQRIKAYLTGKGFETLLVEAALGAGFDDVRGLVLRLHALDRFAKGPGYERAVLTFKRAANIIRKQGVEAGQPLTGVYSAALLTEPAEAELARRLEEIAPRFEEGWQTGDFDSLFGLLGELRPDVDAFFDGVMVMAEDPDLRLNRLNILMALVERLGRLADFSALQV